MAQPEDNIYIPPYSGVRMIESRNRLLLVPVPACKTYYGYGKIKAAQATFESEAGTPDQLWPDLKPYEDIWVVVEWYEFEDGHKEQGSISYIHPSSTEDYVRKRMEQMESFGRMTRQDMLDLSECFRASDDDKDFIEDNYPNYQYPPTDPRATDEHDVYQARLKVMADVYPKTVELIKIADAIKDPEKRQKAEREAVRYFFAEMAHYWTEAEIDAWLRSNPAGTAGLCEFGKVMETPRKSIDEVKHELALNWLRAGYNQQTERELSESFFKRFFRRILPGTLKKIRERLGLTTKRRPGPRPNVSQ